MPSTLGIVASGEDVLNDAVFWVDAGRSSVSGGALTNLGTGGSALNAVFGNTTGVDSFDPALLSHSGTNYLYLPGGTGNLFSVPSSVAFNAISGDIELVVRVALDDWTPATTQGVLERDSGDPNRAWHFRVDTTGKLSFRWFPTGSAASSILASSSIVAPFTDGTTYWVKATLDVDNGAGGWTVQFFYASDQSTEPSTWTKIGADVTGAGVTSLPSVSANLTNGNAAGMQIGKSYRAIVRNGIGGTTVFDADFTTGITSGGQTTFTESSANAATVTINRATSGRKSVAVVRPILLFGTDDYLETADSDLLDFGASDSFTVVAVVRQWATPANSGRIISKAGQGVIAGWHVVNNSTTLTPLVAIGDGTNQAGRNPTALTAGALTATGMIVNRSAQTLTGFSNTSFTVTTSTSAVGNLSNTDFVRIGRTGQGALTNYADMELVAAAVWRRALNANEIAKIGRAHV